MTREEAARILKDFVLYAENVRTIQYRGSITLPVEALNMAIKALQQEPCEYKRTDKRTETHACDCISRQDAIDAIEHRLAEPQYQHTGEDWYVGMICAESEIYDLPSVQQWIPVSERLPEDLEPVNITWVNHEPEPYYHDIKDKNFVATGIHYRDQWYWYSTTCADYLGEYGSNEIDLVDDAIEIVAWKSLPEPYKESEE